MRTTTSVTYSFALLSLFMPVAADERGATDVLADRLLSWGRQLVIDPRVEEEIGNFRSGDQVLPEGYAAALARDMRTAVIEASTEQVRGMRAGAISPFVEVSYPAPGFARVDRQPADSNKAVMDFEQGFILTEGVALINSYGASAEEALAVYVSRAFRKGVSSRVARLWDDDGLDCIETSGVAGLLSPTNCCNRINTLVEPALAAEHAQVVTNDDDDAVQPFFFKESMKTFVALSDGTLAVYYINYSRSVKLGRIKRALGTGQVRASQQKRFDSLQAHFDAVSVQ